MTSCSGPRPCAQWGAFLSPESMDPELKGSLFNNVSSRVSVPGEMVVEGGGKAPWAPFRLTWRLLRERVPLFSSG